ncbi:MAG: hypothetical protein ACTSYR_02140 [Candidatus Odinarchaeia archaeon]
MGRRKRMIRSGRGEKPKTPKPNYYLKATNKRNEIQDGWVYLATFLKQDKQQLIYVKGDIFKIAKVLVKFLEDLGLEVTVIEKGICS